MWGLNGQPMGLLLQGIPTNVKNPKWNLTIDVIGREEEEQAKTTKVIGLSMVTHLKLLKYSLESVRSYLKFIHSTCSDSTANSEATNDR